MGGRVDLNSQIDEGLNQCLHMLGESYDFRGMISESEVAVCEQTDLAITSGSWTTATKTLTKTAAFASYTWVSGDMIYVTGGTDVTPDYYTVASRTSDNAIVLTSEITTTSVDQTNVTASYIGTVEYVVIPSGYHQLISARVIDGTSSTNIDIRPKSDVVARFPNLDSETNDKPVWGYEESGRIYLAPWSDDSYPIRMSISSLPTMGSGTTDEPTLTGVDNVLIHYGTYFAYASQQQFESANYWYSKFRESLGLAMRSDRRKPGMVFKAKEHGRINTTNNSQYWHDPFQRVNP